MSGEITTNPVINALALGGVTGWGLERIISAATERQFPDDLKKATIAELGVIALIDALVLIAALSMTLNSDPQLVTLLIPLIGSFEFSLSGFGYARYNRNINHSTQ